MSKRSEKKSFSIFKRKYSRKAGYSAAEKPTIPCAPDEECERVQPDSAFYNQRKRHLVVVDDKDKARLSMDDVEKICDDMIRGAEHFGAKRVTGFLSVRPQTKASEGVQKAADS